MKNCIKIYFALLVTLFGLSAARSQTLLPQPHEAIAVTGRPSGDSITLRWAPMRFHVWHLGNENGYRIERYVVARKGILLRVPEKQILHSGLKPLPEGQWEDVVKREKYGAIAAQALFGEQFQVDLKNTDVISVVNKVRENEQRFSFALFSADMSPLVAIASGLMFTDRNVRPDEKYLYRVAINAGDTLRGSLFIAPTEPYHMPGPENLTAEFKERYVQLKWEGNSDFLYSAYRVERSNDGINFKPVADSPLTTVSPSETEDTRYHYAIDSIPNESDEFYYRVKGFTPFGEESPPSKTISGRPLPVVHQVPYITAVDSHDNQSLFIRWEFPTGNNNAIDGFTVERTSRPDGPFVLLTGQPLPVDTRTYTDELPDQVNYYRVLALGKDRQQYPSPLYYGQLIDSIAPAFPEGLAASVHEDGIIEISWKPNKDADLHGYRVYKANYASEELSQLTTAPISNSFLIDTVNLNTLNDHVYYSVMAIDRNQNHSKLSEVLKVRLPDKIPPQPPVLLPVASNAHGVVLSWIPSPAEDVEEYAVYRRSVQEQSWKQISKIPGGTDTVYQFTDQSTPSGQWHFYTVVAVDDAGLESEAATPVSGIMVATHLQPPIEWRKPMILREENQITLRWAYGMEGIESYRVYKATGSQPPVLYKTIAKNYNELNDILTPAQNYVYRILAVFVNGQKSALSDALYVNY